MPKGAENLMRSNEWTRALAMVALFTAIAIAIPALAEKEQAKDDGLNHFMVVWSITVTEPEPAQDDVYRPGKKLAVRKDKKVTMRTMCAKEWKTRAEAEKFIADAPPDIKPHCHLINEDQ